MRPRSFEPLENGLVQNLDCGFWTGPWTSPWTEMHMHNSDQLRNFFLGGSQPLQSRGPAHLDLGTGARELAIEGLVKAIARSYAQ